MSGTSKKNDPQDASYRAYLDNAPNAVFVVDATGRYLEVNRAACAITGYTEAELLSMSVPDVAAPEELERTLSDFSGLTETGSMTADVLCKKPDGTRYWLEINAVGLGDDRFVGFATDITERKRVTQALQESERRSHRAERVAGMGFLDMNLETSQVVLSEHAQKVFGVTLEDGGLPREVLRRSIHPDDSARVQEHLQLAVQGVKEFDIDHRILRPDGEVVWVHAQAELSCDAKGRPQRLLGTVIDITARKRAEEQSRSLEAQLQHAQKLESLGMLAGGIAHDFNNLLVGILGNADLALTRFSAGASARVEVEEILKAARVCAQLTNQMLAYSGKGTFVLSEVDLRGLLEDMSNLLGRCVSKNVVLSLEGGEQLPGIEADASQIQQIVLNLVTNASEAVGEDGGRVTVSTYAGTCGPTCPCRETVPEARDWPERPTVVLEVSDTGCGMDEHTRSRIFDPFFTTKFTGRGLGLAAVHGILRGHKASVEVESEPGKGTTFRVHFLALDRPAASAQVATVPDAEWRGSGTILLVDDEQLVREVGTGVLDYLGFTVLTANDGLDAVEVFEKRHAEIACVLLDLTMPRMDGEEALGRLRQIRPDIPVVLTSGYNKEAAAKRFADKGLAGFVQKPYDIQALAAMLRTVLGD